MPRSDKFPLFVGYYGFKNFGDDAMLLGLVKSLDRARYISATEDVPSAIRDRGFFSRRPLKIIRKKKDEVSHIIWGGGTCFYGGLRNQIFLVRLGLTARLTRKKLYYFGVGMGDFDNLFSKITAYVAVLLSSGVYPRDRDTRRIFNSSPLLSLRLKSQVCDPFELYASQLKPTKLGTGTLLNLSTAAYPPSRESIERLWHFIRMSGGQLLSMQPSACSPEHKFISILPDKFLPYVHPATSFSEIERAIIGCESYVGFRLHGAYLAAALNKKVAVYPLSPKVKSFTESVGVDVEIVPLGCLSIADRTSSRRGTEGILHALNLLRNLNH